MVGKKQISKLFFTYGLHLWLIVFLMNVGLYYVAHYYSHGKTCFTKAQVQSDNRCLYIWSGQVYDKGTRSSPHNGHPCGSDVTSVIPASHLANQAKYLLPTNVGEICTAQVPTSTPVPTKTPTPTPTKAVPTNTPTPTSIPTVPTNTPLPTPTKTVSSPTATTAPAATNRPTQTPTVTIAPTLTTAPTSIVAQPTTVVSNPTVTTQPTTIPTPAALIGPGISYAFALPGIGQTAGNYTPAHPSKQVTLFIYPPSVNVKDSTVQPSYTSSTQALYDNNSSSATYGLFVVAKADLGSNVPAGTYQIAFQTNQTTKTLISDSSSDQTGILFQVTPGQVSSQAPQIKDVHIGDLNTDNTIDVKDYNLFVNCYGSKSSSADCIVAQPSDFNDDNVVDGIDYILMLQSIRALLPKTVGYQPLPIVSLAPTGIVIGNGPTTSPDELIKEVSPTQIVLPTKSISAKKPKPTIIPEPTKVPLSLFAAENVISMTKIFSYLAFFLLVVVGILGAFKSRIISAILNRVKASHVEEAPKTEPPATVEKQPEAKI